MATTVSGVFADADAVLRGHLPVDGRPLRDALRLTAWILVCGGLYGAAMGTYGGLDDGRALQLLYSAIKVPWLLLGTFAISLPAFFLFNTLLGLRSDFARSVEALLAGQAVLAMVLLALAPYTLFWYATPVRYKPGVLFNLGMFTVASFAAQHLVRARYRPLIEANRLHAWLLWLWLGLYGFVGIQMAWVLRPFVGDPLSEVQFFRRDAWGNAYEVVWGMIWQALTS